MNNVFRHPEHVICQFPGLREMECHILQRRPSHVSIELIGHGLVRRGRQLETLKSLEHVVLCGRAAGLDPPSLGILPGDDALEQSQFPPRV